MKRLYLGTSGFSYQDWRGRFYPQKLAPRQWLEFYSRTFKSLEINSSFYRLPAKTTFQNWRQQVPANFRFAIKAPRRLTHYRRLNIDDELWQWFWPQVSLLKNKLAVILWQLPANFTVQEERLGQFLRQFAGPIRFAFEFRHSSWFNNRIYKILERYQAAFVWHDNEILAQPPQIATANFVYIRFHGVEALYNYEYGHEQLGRWAKIISRQLKGRDVFAYFNNDPGGGAIKNARYLQQLI